MPLIIPANTLASSFEIDNSCIFAASDSDYMHKTPSSAGNRQKFTLATWVKRNSTGSQMIFSAGSNENNVAYLQFTSGNELAFEEYDNNTDFALKTNATYTDTSVWYHIVAAVDTTQSTDTNRIKIYVDGTLITSLARSVYPSKNYSGLVNTTIAHRVGRFGWNANLYFNGLMSEFVFIDGVQHDVTDFGKFDGSTWKPIDVSGLTAGTNNGFYLDFKASGNLGNDVFGGTDLTEVNIVAGNQSTDTPTS